MYIGPFYLDTKEVFLILAAVLLGVAVYFDWPLWYFDKQTLLVLTVLFLIIRGLLKSVHNDVFFFHALVTIILSLFFPLLQVVLFYALTFAVMKAIKVI